MPDHYHASPTKGGPNEVMEGGELSVAEFSPQVSDGSAKPPEGWDTGAWKEVWFAGEHCGELILPLSQKSVFTIPFLQMSVEAG